MTNWESAHYLCRNETHEFRPHVLPRLGEVQDSSKLKISGAELSRLDNFAGDVYCGHFFSDACTGNLLFGSTRTMAVLAWKDRWSIQFTELEADGPGPK